MSSELVRLGDREVIVDSEAIARRLGARRAIAAAAIDCGRAESDPIVAWVVAARVVAAADAELGVPPSDTVSEILSMRPPGSDAPSPGDVAQARKALMPDRAIVASLALDGGKELLRVVRDVEAQRYAAAADARQRSADAEVGRRASSLLARMGDPVEAPTLDHVMALRRELREIAPAPAFEEQIRTATEAARQRDSARAGIAEPKLSQKHEAPKPVQLHVWTDIGREARGARGARVPS